MEIGVQIDVYREKMTATELGIFCLAGAAATFLVGYSLACCSGSICKIKSKLARVVFGMLFIINGVLFWKKVLPSYKLAFSE